MSAERPLPALTWHWDDEHEAEVRNIGGPERIYDEDAADPEWTPRHVGFTTKTPTTGSDLGEGAHHGKDPEE